MRYLDKWKARTLTGMAQMGLPIIPDCGMCRFYHISKNISDIYTHISR